MQTDFIKRLMNKKFSVGEKLEPEALIIAQKILCRDGLTFLPQSYVEFLKIFNGLKFDGCYLFGASIDDDLDILDKNKQMSKPEGTILLGYNDFDLLCFDFADNKYKIFDRTDNKIVDSFTESERDYALAKILNI